MTLQSGTKLGPYEILSPLGAGGMGEVYRARDTRLEREVAIKILPESFAADADRLRRFEQEARAASQLNHPNIIVVHDFGAQDGSPYVVQELLEGETLGERLRQGPLAPRKAVEYGLEVARGLAAAHEKGIVHRDLKPENIFLTSDGRVKILDFGLAKLVVTEPDSSGISEAPTAALKTRPGVVMGTAGYMSPEQVRGKPTDARTDIFSFGAILYEMLAGRRAFHRDTSAETIAAILKEEPPEFSTLGKSIPPTLERVVNHCLEKSAELRFQSAKDLAFALQSASGSESTMAMAPGREPGKRAWPLWVAAASAAVAIALAVVLFTRPTPVPERMQFAIPLEAEVSNLALSADGRMLAFVSRDDGSGENMLYFERLGEPRATQLSGTEGASYPFWSPDNTYVGFFANGKLEKAPLSGGHSQVIAAATFGRGGSWSSKGIIIYAPDAGGPLWRVNADGTNPAPLTDKVFLNTENSHRWPVFLPDGEHYIFWSGTFGSVTTDQVSGLYVSDLAAREKKEITRAVSNGGYANGYLYYVDDRKSLIAVRVDVKSGKTTGEPVVISDHLTYQPSVFYGVFSVGGAGDVVYSTSSGAALSVMAFCDRAGKELARFGEPEVMANPTLSPDGKRAAVDIADLKTANVDVWIEDLERKTSSRFTFDPAEEVTGVWSRDGGSVAYRSIGPNSVTTELKNASGSQPPKQIFKSNNADDIMPNSWALDGRSLLCTYQPFSGGSDLVILDPATGKMTPFLATKANETNGQISHNGKWAAYASNESGDWEIYVTTFPGAQGKWQISRGGGTQPRWRGDDKEIYYLDLKGVLTAVPVSSEGTFSAGAPQPLFPIRSRAPISSTDLYSYDVEKDGKRFLVDRYVKPDHIQPLTVVLNATAEGRK